MRSARRLRLAWLGGVCPLPSYLQLKQTRSLFLTCFWPMCLQCGGALQCPMKSDRHKYWRSVATFSTIRAYRERSAWHEAYVGRFGIGIAGSAMHIAPRLHVGSNCDVQKRLCCLCRGAPLPLWALSTRCDEEHIGIHIFAGMIIHSMESNQHHMTAREIQCLLAIFKTRTGKVYKGTFMWLRFTFICAFAVSGPCTRPLCAL